LFDRIFVHRRRPAGHGVIPIGAMAQAVANGGIKMINNDIAASAIATRGH
jgi:hypothetical protein